MGWFHRLSFSVVTLLFVGFMGVHCEVNIDDCPANKCANGATCVDGINSYICKCDPRFRGESRSSFNPSNAEASFVQSTMRQRLMKTI